MRSALANGMHTNKTILASIRPVQETIVRLSRAQAERVAAKMNTCRTIIGYGATIVLGATKDAELTPLVAEGPSALSVARARGYVEAYLDCVETAE